MKKLHLLTLLVAALAVFGAAAAQAAPKIAMCHIPPGNPDNWHTIYISVNAAAAHLGHGDLEGSCLANCETLCDDGDACTQDVEPDDTQCLCKAAPTPVNCDDSDPCTDDSCDSVQGCQYSPVTCQPGDACTVFECITAAGGCVSFDVACDPGEICDVDQGGCFDPCDAISCAPEGQCVEAETCEVDGTGTAQCVGGSPKANGTVCDDNDAGTENDVCDGAGGCEGTPVGGGFTCPEGLFCNVFEASIGSFSGCVYDLYAEPNAAGQVTDVFFSTLAVTDVFYQNVFGTWTPPNPIFFGVSPELVFDTFVTIGDLTQPSDTRTEPGFNGGVTSIVGGWYDLNPTAPTTDSEGNTLIARLSFDGTGGGCPDSTVSFSGGFTISYGLTPPQTSVVISFD